MSDETEQSDLLSEVKNDRSGRKPTKKEHLERVEIVRLLLLRRKTKGEIKRLLKQRYAVCSRTVENYLSRARKQIVEATNLTVEEHRADAYAFYCGIVGNEDAETAHRITAQARIDKLLGLEAPQKLAGHDGGPLTFAALLVASQEDEDDEEPEAGAGEDRAE